MAYTLWSLSSDFDVNSQTLSITDQTRSSNILFRIEDRDAPPPRIPATITSVSVVGAPAGLNVTVQNNTLSFNVQVETTPLIPFGDYPTFNGLISIDYIDPDDGPNNTEIHLHIIPLIYKIYYYDNNIGGKLVKYWLHPKYVTVPTVWASGTTYGETSRVTTVDYLSITHTWFAQRAIRPIAEDPASPINTPPSEGLYWTEFPYDTANFHVRAAALSANTTKLTALWAKVFFTTNITGKFVNPVFYANGNIPLSPDPTGKLVGDGFTFETKTLQGGAYNAVLLDSSMGSSFTFSFSYASPDPTDPTILRYPNPRPSGPLLTIVKDITSTFTSNTGAPPVLWRAGSTEPPYPLEINVTNHIQDRAVGTNYANLLYRIGNDFGPNGFADFSPVTTDSTQPIYAVADPINTFSTPVGTTAYQLKFKTEGTYYLIGRPTGDLNQQSSTLGLTTNALQVVVEPAISTAFRFDPFVTPITGTIEVPINMSAVSHGNLRWTLKHFVANPPIVYLCTKSISTGTISKLFALGTGSPADQVHNFSYPIADTNFILSIESNTPTFADYPALLKLENLTYPSSSATTVNFGFARPSASFIVDPADFAMPQFGTGTIHGSYAGLALAVTSIVPSGGAGTLTFGPAAFTGGTTGTFQIPITNATTENLTGYPVLVTAKNVGTDIGAAVANVKVTAVVGNPSISVYNSGSELPVLCQVKSTDNNAEVCGTWNISVLKTDPTTALRNLVNKAYFVLRDKDTNNTKAGLYTISASTDGVNWTPVLNPATETTQDSATFPSVSPFVTIARHNNDTYPISVTLIDSVAVAVPYIYIRASITGLDSPSFKITCIPNIQVVAGTNTTSLTSHTAKIENNAGTFFLVKTSHDGWTEESINRYELPNALYVSFPSPPYLKDNSTWVLQRNGSKSLSSTKYNLFFETNSVTGDTFFFVTFKYPDNSIVNVYRASLTIVNKGGLNLRTTSANPLDNTVGTAVIGEAVNFLSQTIDNSRLYIYRQDASTPTTWAINSSLPSTTRKFTVGATDGAVYVAASSGDIVGAIKYNIVGQGCTLVPTTAFLGAFSLPTASVGYYYPAGAVPSGTMGLKLPSKVEVVDVSGGTPTYKTVLSNGTGWQFVSASYEGVPLEVLSSKQNLRLDSTLTGVDAFKFQITSTPSTTDYKLSLPSGLNLGGLGVSEAALLTIVFKAVFSDGKCATISADMPVRAYTYSVVTPAVVANACDYFPPAAGGSAQYDCGTGYSALEEVIANNIHLSFANFTSEYGLAVFSDTLTTLATTNPLQAATLNDIYYGSSDLNYNVYVVVGNGTADKKIITLSYFKQYTPPVYLAYPQKIGLTTTPTVTSYTFYNGDKVYISLLSTISSVFNFTNYELVFQSGITTIVQAIAGYEPFSKTVNFTVTPGVFTTSTPYTLGLRHKVTDCIYWGTTPITFTCGGPRPSGPVAITQPVEQEPCVPSITVNAESSNGADISAITRVQVYATNAGSVGNNYTGDVSVWDSITPAIGTSGKSLSFLLNNSTHQFASTMADKKEQKYFVSFYTGSLAGGYVPFAQGVSLSLRLKNPVLKGSETNSNRLPSLTNPIPTLYENTLSVTCLSCKDGACAPTNLAALSTITWEDSLSAPLPDWLTLTPDPVNFNKALLSGSPETDEVTSFTITATVPYYVDESGAPYAHTYSFDITLSPTTVFSIGDIAFANADHYQSTYTQTVDVTNRPALDCATLTWSITDRELVGADKVLPQSTLASPITFVNGVFTWNDVDDPGALYPVKYVFGIQAVCTGGSIASGVVTLVVDPRNPAVGSLTPNYGYFDVTNETVVITGLDFYPGTVRFGNEEASNILVNVTNDAITCTPPTKADMGGEDLSVDVVVYNSDGGVSQSGVEYTYQRKRNPIISDIIPAGGTFRGGTKVAILGANFEPTSKVIIDGVAQPLLSVTPTAIIFVTMPYSVGPADVYVTNSTPIPSHGVYNFAAEPRVSDVQPYNLPADGGIDVYIIGTDFQPGVRVFLDDYEIPADKITVI